MKIQNWVAFGGIALGAIGLGAVAQSLRPQRWNTESLPENTLQTALPDMSSFPAIDVTIMRCGTVTIPELVAVRGAFSLAPRVIAHSAILIRHPKATFLYDTGLSRTIASYVKSRSLFFRRTLGSFTMEQPLANHLERLGVAPKDLDFALLSHIHWDHVSGIPDLPGLKLRMNRVEYDGARASILDAYNGLVRELLGDNPIEFFDCNGPSYEGFRSSYDLFGDGSLVLVPLPGHTAGNTGMFINRSNGPRVFLVGDAVWVSPNFIRPTTMHPFIWGRVTSDDASARQTILQLYHYHRQHPEIPMIAMHDAATQAQFTAEEESRLQAMKI